MVNNNKLSLYFGGVVYGGINDEAVGRMYSLTDCYVGGNLSAAGDYGGVVTVVGCNFYARVSG